VSDMDVLAFSGSEELPLPFLSFLYLPPVRFRESREWSIGKASSETVSSFFARDTTRVLISLSPSPPHRRPASLEKSVGAQSKIKILSFLPKGECAR